MLKHLFLSTGKLFFRNYLSNMFLYMSRTFPQNFIIFGTVLLFLTDFIKSDIPASVPSIDRNFRRSTEIYHRSTEISTRSTEDSMDVSCDSDLVSGRPRFSSVDRWSPNSSFQSRCIWFFGLLTQEFLLRFLVGIYTPLLMSFETD